MCPTLRFPVQLGLSHLLRAHGHTGLFPSVVFCLAGIINESSDSGRKVSLSSISSTPGSLDVPFRAARGVNVMGFPIGETGSLSALFPNGKNHQSKSRIRGGSCPENCLKLMMKKKGLPKLTGLPKIKKGFREPGWRVIQEPGKQ